MQPTCESDIAEWTVTLRIVRSVLAHLEADSSRTDRMTLRKTRTIRNNACQKNQNDDRGFMVTGEEAARGAMGGWREVRGGERRSDDVKWGEKWG